MSTVTPVAMYAVVVCSFAGGEITSIDAAPAIAAEAPSEPAAVIDWKFPFVLAVTSTFWAASTVAFESM